MTIELIHHPEGGYATPDNRWRVIRNTDRLQMPCASSRWWIIEDTTNYNERGFDDYAVGVPTLREAKGLIEAISKPRTVVRQVNRPADWHKIDPTAANRPPAGRG